MRSPEDDEWDGSQGAGTPLAPAPLTPPTAPQPMKRAPVNYQPVEPGWWLGADGLWYPPETAPGDPANGPVISNPASGSQNVVVNIGSAQPPNPAYTTGPPKSKVVAGLLALFFGGFGVHRFYLGNVGLGVTMLLLTVLSLGLLSPVVIIWAFIEAIMLFAGGIRTDARGVPLR